MDTTLLEALKAHIDAAASSGDPQYLADLAGLLEQAAVGIRRGIGQDPDPVLRAVCDVYYMAAEPPDPLPGDPEDQARLARLLADMRATQRFALALSQGDLSADLEVRGYSAGSLKSLQASLRHLTWQTAMIAKGDFSQQVDFMGDFSTSFNAMVRSLAEARDQIQRQNEELARINASLREEIASRRQATARLQVQRQLLEQREQERLRIARDLHDGPLQEVIALVYALEVLLQSCNDPAVCETLQETLEIALQVTRELRQFAGELRPPALARFGLKKAIASYLENFQKKHPNLRLEAHLDSNGDQLSETTRLALYRIHQEALNNIVKHAGASRVQVWLQADGERVRLRIEDDGRGFEPPAGWLELADDGHLGLVGMQERAEAAGGQLEIWSRPQQGTRIQVTVPAYPSRSRENPGER